MHSSFLASTSNKKSIGINVLLVTNAFVWYILVIMILQTILANSNFSQSVGVLVWATHFGALIISAIVGASLSKKIKNVTRFLSIWMALGVALSVFSIWADLTALETVFALALLFGFALGVGMPSCMGYFTENVTIEKRGRVGGIIFLLCGLSIVALGAVAGTNTGLQVMILSSWRIFGLVVFLAFLMLYPVKDDFKRSQVSSTGLDYKSLLTQRNFLLYLIPWLLFSLIAYLTLPLQISIIQSMQSNGVNIPSAEYLRNIENVFTAIFAVVTGFLMDYFGRKRVCIIGFAALGLSYSLLGIFPENPISWYFYTVIDGIAWGALFVIFVVTIWADLSNGKNSEKYYAIGVMPFFISYFIKLTAQNDITAVFSRSAIFSLTAFLLFLAVLPLIYAPETLPEKVLKDRDLKGYIETAKKKAEKDREKSRGKEILSRGEEEKSRETADPNYDKAVKLAEKYY
jgi:MFS family permease